MPLLIREDIDRMLDAVIDCGASDLHLISGFEPWVRIDGQLCRLPGYTERLTQGELESFLNITYQGLTGSTMVLSQDDQDYAYQKAAPLMIGSDRRPATFRINATLCAFGLRIVARKLDSTPPHYTKLGISAEIIKQLCGLERGLILVTGMTGSGKSTSLASMVVEMTRQKSIHLLTLEDPIEYRLGTYNSDTSIVTQREFRSTMKSFEAGLKSALRQDIDVVLMGELRDAETIRMAMLIAETGHLVLGTLHTSSVSETIARAISEFPANEQGTARVRLLSSLRLIMCQSLYPSTKGGRVAVREWLQFNPEMNQELIRCTDQSTLVSKLNSLVQSNGRTQQMELDELLSQGLIDEAVRDAVMLQNNGGLERA